MSSLCTEEEIALTLSYAVLAPPLAKYHPSSFDRLVLAGSLLASLELIKVPSTDSQRALVLIHASSEVVDIGLASSWLTVAGVLNCTVVVLCERLLLSSCWLRATAKEATDGMTDG